MYHIVIFLTLISTSKPFYDIHFLNYKSNTTLILFHLRHSILFRAILSPMVSWTLSNWYLCWSVGLSYQYLITLFQILIIKAKIFKFHCLILSLIFYLWVISGKFLYRWFFRYIIKIYFYPFLSIGITNVYPLLKGIKWECVNEAFGSNVDFLMRVECNGYLFSTIFGWFMILEFFTSTMLYLRLWKTRNWWDNNITIEDGESEKGINLGTDEVIFIFFRSDNFIKFILT